MAAPKRLTVPNKKASYGNHFPVRNEKSCSFDVNMSCRKFSTILVVANAAVVTAALAAFLRSTIYILKKQTFRTEYQRARRAPVDRFEFSKSTPTSPNSSHQSHGFSTETDEEVHSNLVFVLDCWERMVNIQSGLRRLVNIGVESGFTVIEPFMYESRIQPVYSDPYHFTTQNMTPQPAMHYFQTQDLFFTNSYISHEEAMKKIERVEGNHTNAMNAYVIHAAVYFNWPDEPRREGMQEETHSSPPFRWCDEKLHTMVASPSGHMLSNTSFIERAVCLSVKNTMSPSVITPQYFRSLFDFVRKGTRNIDRRCDRCVALAFMNYRKHAFNGFMSNLGTQPFKQKVPPLEVGAFGKELGKRVRTEVLGRRPYVAIQIRTGKVFTLFERHENGLLLEIANISRYSSFKDWLQSCTRKISSVAKRQGRQLGRRAVYYIASDMFNDGWKGGEECPEEVQKALDKAKGYLSKELYPIYWFEPKMLGVRQDMMGTSSITDAAVSREADKFLFAQPSNFGRWVAEQREVAGTGEIFRINCMDERLIDM